MGSPDQTFEGILLVDKPPGITSHDVVNRVRRRLQMRRVGHAGTLDPTATGLLIILVGKATKVSQYLMSLDKIYEGTLKLGQSTDTHDTEGEVVEDKVVPELSVEEVGAYFDEFVGDQYQIPPMFSAKKIGGVPLYKLARRGKVVEREARFIRVSSIELKEVALPLVDFRISCSKGTYVRTLVHDLGQRIGCGAHLVTLRRIAIERVHLEDAVSLEEFEASTTDLIHRLLIPAYQLVPSNVL